MKWLSRIFAPTPDDQKPASVTNASASDRMARATAMGECAGLLVSKQGDSVIRLYGGVTVPVGEWLYFLHHLETLPDGRIIFADAGCFWIQTAAPFAIRSVGGNMFRPVPDGINDLVIGDGSYADWGKAFAAIDAYFSNNDSGWRNQWSWRTDRVKALMLGRYSDWITKRQS